MPQQNLREAMPRAQEISADVLAIAQQIASRFFLLGGNGEWLSGRQRDTAPQVVLHRASVLMRSPARRGINAGAITSHVKSRAVRARCRSKPHGPAS